MIAWLVQDHNYKYPVALTKIRTFSSFKRQWVSLDFPWTLDLQCSKLLLLLEFWWYHLKSTSTSAWKSFIKFLLFPIICRVLKVIHSVWFCDKSVQWELPNAFKVFCSMSGRASLHWHSQIDQGSTYQNEVMTWGQEVTPNGREKIRHTPANIRERFWRKGQALS